MRERKEGSGGEGGGEGEREDRVSKRKSTSTG